MTRPTNPYPTREVFEDGEFVGRQKELREICQGYLNETSTHLLLTGPRRIGKSSILRRFEAQLTGRAASGLAGSALVAYVDCRDAVAENKRDDGTQAATELLFLIATELGYAIEDLGKSIDVPAEVGQPETFTDFLEDVFNLIDDRRPVVLLDELEKIEEAGPDAVDTVLSALDLVLDGDGKESRPFVVLAWGHAVGAQRNDLRLADRLKASWTIRLDPFERHEVQESADLVKSLYGYDPAAVDRLIFWSGCQPLFVNAINSVVFDRRALELRQGNVTAEEIDEAVDKASTGISSSSEYVLAQVTDNAQRVLIHEVARLTFPFRTEKGVNTISSLEISQELLDQGLSVFVHDLPLAARGLEDNYVISFDQGRYRLCAPLMGHWILDEFRSYERILIGNTAKADRLVQQAEEIHLRAQTEHGPQKLRSLELAFGIARDASIDDPKHPEAFDLYHRIGEELESCRQILEIDKHLEDWRASMDAGDIEAAVANLNALADKDWAEWRPHACAAYAEFASEPLKDGASLELRFVAIPRMFPFLTEGIPATAGPRPKWWVATFRVLDQGWDRHIDRDDLEIPIDVLNLIDLRCPVGLRDELIQVYSKHLPSRLMNDFPELLREDAQETASVIDLICRFAPKSCRRELWGLLEEHALELAANDSALDQIGRFIDHAAPMYETLLDFEYGSDDLDPVKGFVDQVDLVFRQAEKLARADVLPLATEDAISSWNRVLQRSDVQRTAAGPALAEQVRNLAADIDAQRREEHWQERFRKDDIAQMLRGHKIRVTKRLNPPIYDGVPKGSLQLYIGTLEVDDGKNEPVHIKVSRFPTGDEHLESLLRNLWARERRILAEVGSRHRGRALTQIKFERFDEEMNCLVVVTDAPHQFSLRECLDALVAFKSGDESHPALSLAQRITGKKYRHTLYRELIALLEAVHALHDCHYIHRFLRPESVFVCEEDESEFQLKLGELGWAIYLRSLLEAEPRNLRTLDRYIAPESLRMDFGSGHSGSGEGRHAGENYASDVYSLGLLLYEVLVEPLSMDRLRLPVNEVGQYSNRRMKEWIDEDLRPKIERLGDDPAKQTWKHIIGLMLHFDSAPRATMKTVAGLVRAARSGQAEIAKLLDDSNTVLFAADFDSHKWMAGLRRLHGGNQRHVRSAQENLQAYVAKQLAGACVYRNGVDADWPLFIDCHDICLIAQPVPLSDREGDGKQDFQYVPRLAIARPEHGKLGEAIFELRDVIIEIESVASVRKQAARGGDRTELERRGTVWERVFEYCKQRDGHLDRKQREFHSILKVNAEAERLLWEQSVVNYEVAKRTSAKGNGKEWIEIKGVADHPADTMSLADFVAQQTRRDDNRFELGTADSAMDPIDVEGSWRAEVIDPHRNRVFLSRHRREKDTSSERPGLRKGDTGKLRPAGLAGNRAIYSRRRDLIRRLDDDSFLLGAATEPDLRTTDVPGPATIPFFNSKMDTDKERIVRKTLEKRPLFVVQGPPGTGKTTLAAEVIAQTLRERESARILITSQAHDPLNNLLLRVDQSLKKGPTHSGTRSEVNRQKALWRTRRPLAVRLVAQERLLDSGQPEAIAIARDFHPAEIAKRHLAAAEAWDPADHGFDFADKWKDLFNKHRDVIIRELHDRVVAAANLVYVTANDRMISQLSDNQQFDLLIYEEAAKAYPLEVLAPMRLARRWLLIGDQNQLPPYNIREFRDELLELFEKIGAGGGADKHSQKVLGDLELRSDTAKTARQYAEFFAWLHGHKEAWKFADTLSKQWRMHPDIGDMVGSIYYKNKLVNGDPEQLPKRHRYKAKSNPRASLLLKKIDGRSLVWLDVPQAHYGEAGGIEQEEYQSERTAAGGGFHNPFEASVIFQFFNHLYNEGITDFGDVMILSPYKAQVRMINKFLEDTDLRHLHPLQGKAVTVDSAQGRQAEVVVVSLVRNNAHTKSKTACYGFLESEQRCGVMFSRAETLLVVVGSSAHFSKFEDFHLHRACEFICARGPKIQGNELLDKWNRDLLREHDLRRRQRNRNWHDRFGTMGMQADEPQ